MNDKTLAEALRAAAPTTSLEPTTVLARTERRLARRSPTALLSLAVLLAVVAAAIVVPLTSRQHRVALERPQAGPPTQGAMEGAPGLLTVMGGCEEFKVTVLEPEPPGDAHTPEQAARDDMLLWLGEPDGAVRVVAGRSDTASEWWLFLNGRHVASATVVQDAAGNWYANQVGICDELVRNAAGPLSPDGQPDYRGYVTQVEPLPAAGGKRLRILRNDMIEAPADASGEIVLEIPTDFDAAVRQGDSAPASDDVEVHVGELVAAWTIDNSVLESDPPIASEVVALLIEAQEPRAPQPADASAGPPAARFPVDQRRLQQVVTYGEGASRLSPPSDFMPTVSAEDVIARFRSDGGYVDADTPPDQVFLAVQQQMGMGTGTPLSAPRLVWVLRFMGHEDWAAIPVPGGGDEPAEFSTYQTEVLVVFDAESGEPFYVESARPDSTPVLGPGG